MWREAPDGGGLIFAVGHVGNNEAVAASIARHGMPISVVADDSSFPELFELLRRQRESWGVHVIAWRNLREIFGVLRRHEMLGLLIDWGYRADGIPVRLFGAWTALPAGPATLAAKTGSRILPITIRRQPDGTFHVSWPAADRRRLVRPGGAPAGDPGDGRRPGRDHRAPRPTSGTASSRSGRRPGRRSPTSSAGRGSCRRASPDPGPAGGTSADARWPAAPRPSARWRPARLLIARLVAGLPPARGPARRAWPSSPATLWYRATPDRAAQARRNLRRVGRGAGRATTGAPRRVRAAASDPRALERLVRARLPACRALLPRGRADAGHPARATSTSGWPSRPRTSSPRRSRPAGGRSSSACISARIELPALFLASRVGGAVAPMETIDDPGPAGLVRAHPRRRRASASSGCARRAASCSPRSATGRASGSSAIAT